MRLHPITNGKTTDVGSDADTEWASLQSLYAHKEAEIAGWLLTPDLQEQRDHKSGQYISREEWGDQWEWAFLPSPFSLDAARINQHTLERG